MRGTYVLRSLARIELQRLMRALRRANLILQHANSRSAKRTPYIYMYICICICIITILEVVFPIR